MYQYAKLRMLPFYYDFMDKYLDRSDFQMCEMDTDSAYIAIAGESVESLVKPELKAEFKQDKCSWFPRTDTPEQKAYDKRTPSLFKVEWEGEGVIGLCRKTYYCFGAKDKFSCKGVNKKCHDINKDKHLNVLLTKQKSSGVNRGFRVVNNTIYTYTQVRDAFSYFYPKRKVLEDGVSTTPLDIYVLFGNIEFLYIVFFSLVNSCKYIVYRVSFVLGYSFAKDCDLHINKQSWQNLIVA